MSEFTGKTKCSLTLGQNMASQLCEARETVPPARQEQNYLEEPAGKHLDLEFLVSRT